MRPLLLDKNIDSVSAANDFSRGLGVDAVIITASTNSNEPVHNAALMCRKRGRIILVGVVGLDIQRNDFYEKKYHFRYHARMVQVDMIHFMKIKEMTILLVLLGGQKIETSKQF